MPWDIKRSADGYCIHKKDGTLVKCHPSEIDAKKHLAALYANVEDSKEYNSNVIITKEGDGRYKIISISTAALEDKEGETFSIAAMDYDIKEAERTGVYPEYRVFHDDRLGIGQVEKMYRVGIFMVDEGHSYDDPFSQHVVKELLINNKDGKWRVSRGFEVRELHGSCPHCNEMLVLQKEHFFIGFKCPACKQVHLRHKGVLKQIAFQKVRTFDVTVTDVPAVAQTSVQAFGGNMTKKQLKQRLLDAGLDEVVVDERLKDVDETTLKEFSDVPDAIVLKEFGLDEATEKEDEADATDSEADAGDVEITKEVIDAIKGVVKEALDEHLNGLELDIDTGTETKEHVDSLRAELREVKELLVAYINSDSATVQKMLADQPRSTKKRVMRFKSETSLKGGKMPMDMEDEEDEDEEDEDEVTKSRVKELRAWVNSTETTRAKGVKRSKGDVIADGYGNTYGSMTEMLTSN